MNVKEISFFKMFVGVAFHMRKLKGATKLNERQLGMMLWADQFETFTLNQFMKDYKSERLSFYLTIQELRKKGYMEEVAKCREVTYCMTIKGKEMVDKIKKFLFRNNPLKPKYGKAPYNGGLQSKVQTTEAASAEQCS